MVDYKNFGRQPVKRGRRVVDWRSVLSVALLVVAVWVTITTAMGAVVRQAELDEVYTVQQQDPATMCRMTEAVLVVLQIQ